MKKLKKVFSALLAFVILSGMVPPEIMPQVLRVTPSAEAYYYDVDGHWAAGVINRWDNFGFIDKEVFPEPDFDPDVFITRGEFFSLLVRSLGANIASTDFIDPYSAPFNDLWELPDNLYDVVAVAYQMGIANGYPDGTMRPYGNLLRQDAATLTARALGMSTMADWELSRFTDSFIIASYARTYVAAFVAKGLLNGYGDGTLRPENYLTRAEAVKMLDNIFTNVYLPEAGYRNIYLQGDLLIQTPGAELRDVVINGDVIVGDGVGFGNVVFANCDINGRLIIRGGGPNSITLNNTTVSQGMYVASFSADTHISVTDSSTVPILEAVSGFSLSGGGVAALTLLENAKVNAIVNLDGVSLDDLVIGGAGATVNLNSGHVINARFDEAGQNANLIMAPATSVAHMMIFAPNAKITGKGRIANLVINNAGASVEQAPETFSLGANINAKVGGADVSGPDSQWPNDRIDRISVGSTLKLQLLDNTSGHAPFDQAALALNMAAGAASAEAYVTQAAASRIPLTDRFGRLAYWIGFFVPAPPDAANMASVYYEYILGSPVTIPPKTLDTYNGRQGLIIYLPVFIVPGTNTGYLNELLHINWGGQLTENIRFIPGTARAAAGTSAGSAAPPSIQTPLLQVQPLNSSQRTILETDFNNRIMRTGFEGYEPFTGGEATRRILNSDNPLGIPTSSNQGLDAINRALTSMEAQGVLEDPKFASDLTVNTSVNSQYSRLSNAGKLWVAGEVLTARKTQYANPAAVKAAFDKAVQTRLDQETSLLRKINESGDFSLLRTIIENSANAAILEFQTGADPYKSFSNSKKDDMAKYLWNLRQYNSIQEVIDAIRKYLGDPANALPPSSGGDVDIRDFVIQRISVNVTPNNLSLAFRETRTVTLSVELTDGTFMTAAQIGSLIGQKRINYKWDGAAEENVPKGAVGYLESMGSGNLNAYKLTCDNRGLTAQGNTDKLTFSLRDANNKLFTASVSFTVRPFVAATDVLRVVPDEVRIFLTEPAPIRQLEAVLAPPNATEKPKWYSDKPEVATVDEDTGIVTGISSGIAMVRAEIDNGQFKECRVFVFRNADDVVVDPDKVILTPGGWVTVTAYPATITRGITATPDDETDTKVTATWSATTITIRAPYDAEIGTTWVYVSASPNSTGIFATIEVEVRESTGVEMYINEGSVLQAGERYELMFNLDEDMINQRFYVRTRQMTDGMALAAYFVGGETTPVTSKDRKWIQADAKGTGEVRIQLFTVPTGGTAVAELFVVVAPASPELVTFSHTGTTGTWYPTPGNPETRKVPAGTIEKGNYGRILPMQISDAPRVTASNPLGNLSSSIDWIPLVSNEWRKVLYEVDTTATGGLLNRNGEPVTFNGAAVDFDDVFNGSGGPIWIAGQQIPGAPLGTLYTDDYYEFHTPNNLPGATLRYGFLREISTYAEEARQFAVLRGGGLRKVGTPLLSSENGNLIALNPIENTLAPGVATGLAAVAISPKRNITSVPAAREWGDLFFQKLSLWAPNPSGGQRIFNPEIAEQSGFVAQYRDGSEWKDIDYGNLPATWPLTITNIYDITENLVSGTNARDYRIADKNRDNGLVLSEEPDSVSAIRVGDPNREDNVFYVRILPDPIIRPQDANTTEVFSWEYLTAQDPTPHPDKVYPRRIPFRPGSNDRYDYGDEHLLVYPNLVASAEAVADKGNLTVMGVENLSGGVSLSYIVRILSQLDSDTPAPPAFIHEYNYLYSIVQVSRRGFAPDPSSGMGGSDRQGVEASSTYTNQNPQLLQYILQVTPPSTADPPTVMLAAGTVAYDFINITRVKEYLLDNGISGTDWPNVTLALAGIANDARVEFTGLGGRLVSIPANAVTGASTLVTVTSTTPAATVNFRIMVSAAGSINPLSALLPFTFIDLDPGNAGPVDPGPADPGGAAPAAPDPGAADPGSGLVAPPIGILPIVGASAMISDDASVMFALLSAGIDPAEAVYESLTEDLLTIDDKGKANFRAPGKAKVGIKSKDGKKSAEATIDIKASAAPPPAVSYAVPKTLKLRTSATVVPGSKLALTPYFDILNVDPGTLEWTSLNAAVATVDANGVVTGQKAGSANIVLTVKDTKLKATCKITVIAPNAGASGITVSKTELALGVGASSTLTVKYTPTNAAGRGVTWRSSDESVARVSPTGAVTGIKAGVAVITAVCDLSGVTASCAVTVNVPVKGIALTEKTKSMKAGETAPALAFTFNPDNPTNTAVTWKSSNSKIVEVSENGALKAVAAGTATITVTSVDGKKNASCRITVTK